MARIAILDGADWIMGASATLAWSAALYRISAHYFECGLQTGSGTYPGTPGLRAGAPKSWSLRSPKHPRLFHIPVSHNRGSHNPLLPPDTPKNPIDMGPIPVVPTSMSVGTTLSTFVGTTLWIGWSYTVWVSVCLGVSPTVPWLITSVGPFLTCKRRW